MMYCSYNWLRQLTVFKNKTVTDFQTAFDDLGMEPVVVRNDAKLNHNLVVGQIVALKPHPTKNQLTICQVLVNENEKYQVICGATNLKINLKIVFAKPKAILFNQKKITKANFAGVRSEGMICALYEVMPDQKVSNEIIVLPQNAQNGDSEPLKYLHFDDVIWKLELTLGTRHLQNYFGLSHYLAQYWKLANANDFDYLTQYQSIAKINNALQCSLPSNELVLMVKNPSQNQLSNDIKMILQKVSDYQANFITDLNTYIKLYSGCEISIAFANSNHNYQALKWDQTSQSTNDFEWMLIRIVKFNHINVLPPIFPIVAFHTLLKLLQSYNLPLFINFKLKLPAPSEIMLDSNELNRILGINLELTTVKKLFDLKIWKITAKDHKWKFIVPLNQRLTHPFELIEEITRLLGYDRLLAQSLTATDLPDFKQLNIKTDLWIRLQTLLVNQTFFETRIPFQIEKQVANNYYNLKSSWLSELLKLVQKYQKPAFSINTVWKKIDQTWNENQELLLMLPALKQSNQNKIQFQFQTHQFWLMLIRKIFRNFNLPLVNLSYQPVNFNFQTSNQPIDIKIGYQTPSKTFDLITIGYQIDQTKQKSQSMFPYLIINYDLLTDLIIKFQFQPITFVPFQKQSEFEQTVAYFDLNLNFTIPIELFLQQKDDKQITKIDLIGMIKSIIKSADKRILNVKVVDFYHNNRITFRVYWNVKNQISKPKTQQKLIEKVKTCLKVIKNVKI